MAKKLFVGGLAWASTDETLANFFSQVGTVVSANIVKDRFSGRSRGYGFVEMSSDDEAEKAKVELNGKVLDDRTITVNDARTQEPRTDQGVPQQETPKENVSGDVMPEVKPEVEEVKEIEPKVEEVKEEKPKKADK